MTAVVVCNFPEVQFYLAVSKSFFFFFFQVTQAHNTEFFTTSLFFLPFSPLLFFFKVDFFALSKKRLAFYVDVVSIRVAVVLSVQYHSCLTDYCDI